MKLELTFKNIRPRDEIRQRAQMLADKLDRFVSDSATGHLMVNIEHQKALLELHISDVGEPKVLAEEDEELRTALDRIFHKAEMKLRRSKERRKEHRRGGEKEDGFVEDDA